METNNRPKIEAAKCLQNVKFTLPDDSAGAELFTNLFELLTPKWEGKVCKRQAGKFSLTADGSGWRVRIECPTEGLQASFVVKSLESAFCEAEDHVSGGSCHWGLTWARQKKNLPTIDSLIE